MNIEEFLSDIPRLLKDKQFREAEEKINEAIENDSNYRMGRRRNR